MDTNEQHLHLENGLGFCDTIDIQSGLARAGLAYIPFFHHFPFISYSLEALLCGVSLTLFFSPLGLVGISWLESKARQFTLANSRTTPDRNGTTHRRRRLSFRRKDPRLPLSTPLLESQLHVPNVGAIATTTARITTIIRHPPATVRYPRVLRLIHVLDRPQSTPIHSRPTTGTWSPSRMFGRTRLSFAEDKWPAHPPCSAHPPPRPRRNPSLPSSL